MTTRTEQSETDQPSFQKKGRVFLLNMGYHDYSSAAEFGEFIPLSKGRVNITNTDRLEGEMQDLFEENSFNPERDYVLLSGSILQAYLMGGYLGKKYGTIKTLYWDALLGAYREREFSFERKKVGG